MQTKTVFLGGTCNNSEWREVLIPQLKIDYYNPVVKNWTPECQATEIEKRKTSDFVLYTITPRMTGVFSIAEVVDDSNKRPEKTIFCILSQDQGDLPLTQISFNVHQAKSLRATGDMVKENGGQVFFSLEEVANFLNENK